MKPLLGCSRPDLSALPKNPWVTDFQWLIHRRRCGELLKQIDPGKTGPKPELNDVTVTQLTRTAAATQAGLSERQKVTAACQMNGLNDPGATRKQRIAAMTCYEMLMEAIMAGIESGLHKERIKQMMNDAIHQAAEFFNLGNKKAVMAREKTSKKANTRKSA